MTTISTALPSGRLLEDSKNFLKKIGINVKEPANRELISYENGYTFYFPRAFDVPVYVENGVDIGICGSDVALERNNEVYIPLELPFGKCRMSIIFPENREISFQKMEGYRIATKYPEITKNFFSEKGLKVKILKLNGAVELAAKTGIADAIVDIVDTGNTIKANNLKEAYKIMDISAVLLVNRITQKTKFDFINDLINKAKQYKDGGKGQ